MLMMFLALMKVSFAASPKYWANKLPIHSCPIRLPSILDVEKASDSFFLHIRLRIFSWSFPTMQTDITADSVRSAKREFSISFGSAHNF